MPYNVKKEGDKFAIVKSSTGEVVGKSDTRKKANASVRARMMGESMDNKNMSTIIRRKRMM